MHFNLLRIAKNCLQIEKCGMQKRYNLGTSRISKESENDNKQQLQNADDEIEKEIPYINCNKSRLQNADRNRLLNRKPYAEPQSWIHLTERYQRKMFALYGCESGVNPRICFETKTDLEARKRYEQIAEPHTLQYMMAKAKEEKERRRNEILKREEDIAKKMEKLEQWKTELRNKIAKKEAEAIAAKERKDRLVEEVRRHFGYKIDPRDERFKEVFEQKEKEEKKKMKAAKRQAKEEKTISKLIASTSTPTLTPNETQ